MQKCKDTKQILLKLQIITIHRVHSAQMTLMSKRQYLCRNTEDRIFTKMKTCIGSNCIN